MIVGRVLCSRVAPAQKLHRRSNHFVFTACFTFSGFPAFLTEPAVHQHLSALLQKALAALGNFAKCDDINKTDFFLEFVVQAVTMMDRKRKLTNRHSARRVAKVGISGEVPEQDHLVVLAHGTVPVASNSMLPVRSLYLRLRKSAEPDPHFPSPPPRWCRYFPGLERSNIGECRRLA